MTINDLETFGNALYLFIHLLVLEMFSFFHNLQVCAICIFQWWHFFILLTWAISSTISTIFSPIKSGRELCDEWDWATSANTASEFVAVVGGVGVLDCPC